MISVDHSHLVGLNFLVIVSVFLIADIIKVVEDKLDGLFNLN